MKKAGIITHYDVHNHGAHLQLYALSQRLKELGYDAKALKFQKNYDFMGGAGAGKKYNISIHSIPTYLRYLMSNGADRTIFNIRKRKELSKFRVEHDLVGEYYSEAKDLDVVVIGSDEIFSIEAGPNPWYYGIGVPCAHQISYAASFGPTDFKMIEKRNVGALVEAGLKHLDHITVRDRNSAQIVKHYTGQEPPIVCDPVLLYDFPEQLNKDSIDDFKKSFHEKYCLVYSYDYNMNDKPTVEAIRAYAKKRGLKIYSVGYFHRWCDKNVAPNPIDIFKWFLCSEIVFTDTFHGTVISLETHTQFISLIRGNGNKLAFLLDQYGVSKRKVDDFNAIEELSDDPIDYDVVGKTILKIRGESMEHLKNALEI